MDNGIEDFLNDDEPEIEAQPETIGQPRDENGRFIPTGEPEPETVEAAPVEPESVPPTPEVERDHVPVAALKSEREKRQWAEQQLAEMQARFAQQPVEAPSVFEDEAAWQQNFGGQVVNEAVSRATLNARLDMSEMLVRQTHPDFDQVKEQFLALARDNPTLAYTARSDPHPWNKAYQIAKNHQAMQELGATDMTTLRQQIEAKVREELKASIGLTAPTSLAAERSIGSRNGPAWTGPAPLDDLLQ